jgi:cell shape-determining protein MreD
VSLVGVELLITRVCFYLVDRLDLKQLMFKVFMPYFIVVLSLFFVVVCNVVEVRLRGSLSACSAIPNGVYWEASCRCTTTKLQSSNVIMSQV